MLALLMQSPTYDALDECPDTRMPSAPALVLERVNELVGLCLPNLHICVASRPEYDIKVTLWIVGVPFGVPSRRNGEKKGYQRLR